MLHTLQCIRTDTAILCFMQYRLKIQKTALHVDSLTINQAIKVTVQVTVLTANTEPAPALPIKVE